MAKADLAKQQALEKENALLREKIALQEKAKEQVTPNFSAHLQSEIKKIRQKGKSTANTIVVREEHDHKNISLWTRIGKRIGPMHPDNAERLLNDMAAAGVMLTVDRPTAEQIEAYKQTAEWKKIEEKERQRRIDKDKTKRTGQLEKLAKEIAAMAGTSVEAINKILKAHEVKPLSEARG